MGRSLGGSTRGEGRVLGPADGRGAAGPQGTRLLVVELSRRVCVCGLRNRGSAAGCVRQCVQLMRYARGAKRVAADANGDLLAHGPSRGILTGFRRGVTTA
jgi:hypothetical protein